MASEAPKATETLVVSTGDKAATEKVEEKKVEEWKPRISVFNLPPGVTSQDELRELCKPFGTITNVEFVPAKGNRNAFGFVTFKTKGDAEYAIYRLNEENFGGKVRVKAKWPPEKEVKPKDESGASDGKPKKPKKPMTSLSLLTPKNVASNAQPQGAQMTKKGWDIPAQGQNNQQGGQKKQYQQVQQGGDPNSQNQYPKGAGRGKKGPNQGRPNPQAGGQQQPGGNQQKPVHQPRPNQGGQQAAGQQQQQHPNQPHPNQGPKPKKNQQQQNDAQHAQVPQNSQPQQRSKAPQQNQQQPLEAHPALIQNASHPPQHNTQQQQHNTQPQQQQQPLQPRNPKRKPKKAYVVTVADGKTGLPLHVINLSKPQFDQYIGPLVVKPSPQ